MLIGKEYIFDSAHSIAGHARCGQVHGHTWTLEVMVDGNLQDNGMVVDFHDLNDVVRPIIKDLDHTYLNDTIAHSQYYHTTFEEINGSRPVTAETLTRFLAYVIYHKLCVNQPIQAVTCRLREGLGGWAEATYPGVML